LAADGDASVKIELPSVASNEASPDSFIECSATHQETAMPLARLLQSPRARRGIAAAAIVLSLGGLVLLRAPAAARGDSPRRALVNGTQFSGPGLEGSLALSHAQVLVDGRETVFAELRMHATNGIQAADRAPLALAIVLDTSGSMSGNKLREARQSVLRLLDRMSSDDQVALVRYDSRAQLMQPLARVGRVRRSLSRRLGELRASGGTNIPAALRAGLGALRPTDSDRVTRLVLVSDGLDDTRALAADIARGGTARGVTVSALGIGLDFDEAYLSELARVGRGNFGFVDDASTLARFLERELRETAATTVAYARATLRLSPGLHFVRAVGAEIAERGDDAAEIELRVGSLFAGDERRVVIELRHEPGWRRGPSVSGRVSWQPVGDATTQVALDTLRLGVTDDRGEVEAGRDPAVYASCSSALASLRQLAAAEAFAHGDAERARRLIAESTAELDKAAAGAPAPLARSLGEQSRRYRKTGEQFATEAPESAAGRTAAKRATEQDNANLGRQAY